MLSKQKDTCVHVHNPPADMGFKVSKAHGWVVSKSCSAPVLMMVSSIDTADHHQTAEWLQSEGHLGGRFSLQGPDGQKVTGS